MDPQTVQLEEIAPFTWRVPRTGDMRVDGVVFGSRELVEKARADKAVEQVMNVAALPGIVGASYAMPDIHWGYGFPIGGVAATDPDEGGVVSPGGVGFDISCGVRLIRTELEWTTDVQPRISDLVHTLGQRVPRGVGTKGRLRLSPADMLKVLSDGVRFALGKGIGTEADAEFTEDGGTLQDARPEYVSDKARHRGAEQLGSLGAGNHFLEVQVVEEIHDERAANVMRLYEGQVCVMLHTGSRGIGHQVCTDFLKTTGAALARYGIRVPDRQLACLPITHGAAERYLGAMYAAANYARANRHLLTDGIRESFEHVFNRSSADMHLELVYDVAHNLAKFETHEVDGGERRLCVHRKGATRAFGPGHPEIPAAYREIGQPVIIPGSMGTASYVLVGTAEAAGKSFSSTCHGAGRAMSRTQAKKVQAGHELVNELRSRGITIAASQPRLLAEEAPYAYKDVSAVVESCQGAGLSRTVARLRPVGVVKG